MPTAVTAPERDEIGHPLERMRGLIRRYVVVDSLLTVGLFAAVWCWAVTLLDYGFFKLTNFDWVLDAPRSFRILALSAALLLLLGLVITRLVLRLRRELSDASLALLLEKRFPNVLGDRLITAVEMADLDHASMAGYSTAMLTATIDEARRRVETVPVETVFNWARLRFRLRLLIAIVLAGGLTAYAVHAVAAKSTVTRPFFRKGADVAWLLAKRNLLIAQAPWPRRAHLVILTPSTEIHYAGRDVKPAPKLALKAYQWVIADDGDTHGWRPMLWKDLTDLVDNRPDLKTLRQADGQAFPADFESWDLDRAEAALGRKDETVAAYFDRLERLTERSKMSLKFRKLVIPENVTVNYTGTDGSFGKLVLNREAGNVFRGELEGLSESVRYTVRGEDFTTQPRTIEVIPAPSFQELGCIEYQPAYLYHAPPTGPGPPNFQALRGLVQRVDAGQLPLTGEKSVLKIAKGSEFDFTVTSDKPLLGAFILPKDPSAGGVRSLFRYAGMELPANIRPAADTPLIRTDDIGRSFDPAQENKAFSNDGKTVSIPFRGAFTPKGSFEFDLVIADQFGVMKTRTVSVELTESRPPAIDLNVDILRKVGDGKGVVKEYKITPAAVVPFRPSSRVLHDRGLGPVVYYYEVRPLDSPALRELQMQTLAGALAQLPLPVSALDLRSPVADQYLAWVRMSIAHSMFRPNRPETGTTPLPPYRRAFDLLRREDPESLRKMLNKPLDATAAQVIKEVKLESPKDDGFDVQAALPKLAAGMEAVEGGGLYSIELLLRAADANPDPAVTDSPRFRFLVVSEGELMMEMTADEKKMHGEIDLLIKSLEKASKTLDAFSSYLRSDDFAKLGDVPLIRVKELGQEFDRHRKTTLGIVDRFQVLDREAEFNRIGLNPPAVTESAYRKTLSRNIITPLTKQVLEVNFTELDAKHKAVRTELEAGRKPDESLMAEDLFALKRLIAELEAIQKNIKAAATLEQSIASLEKIGDTQEKVISRFWKNFKVQRVEQLSKPKLEALKPIELATGQSKKITHPVNWRVYTGALSVKFEGPGDDKVKLPGEVKVDEDRNDFDYTLSAGQTPGEYTVKLIPSAGEPIEIKVIVK